MIRSALVAALSTVFLAACSGPADAPSVEVVDAYIVAPSGGRDIAGGGALITANAAGYTLTGVETTAAETVELHTMAMEDGVMRMRKVESFNIAAGTTRALESGGDHLMFFGVDDALAPGDSVELLMDFEGEDGSTNVLSIRADVRALGED